MYVKFTARPDKREEWAELLPEGAEGAKHYAGTELYIVNLSDEEPDTIWVTEVWSDAESHQASLQLEETKASIQRALSLIAGVESIKVKPLAGKGI